MTDDQAAPTHAPLPLAGPAFDRPSADMIQQLYNVSSATATATLHHLGVRQTFIQGPAAMQRGRKIVGPAVTLQFMPQREDIVSGMGQEYIEKQSALWAVFESVLPGDILAIQAYGDLYTGCLGEMLITYFKGRGGAGLVIDGCIRDWPRVQSLDVPLWGRGATPMYASQGSLFPWAYNVPIACSRVLVMPGDIIIADDDGAVLIPQKMAALVAEHTRSKEEWEEFSRMKLAQGGALKTYYPLSAEGQQEYEIWKQTHRPE